MPAKEMKPTHQKGEVCWLLVVECAGIHPARDGRFFSVAQCAALWHQASIYLRFDVAGTSLYLRVIGQHAPGICGTGTMAATIERAFGENEWQYIG
jgi:hypothetical protein